MEKNKKTVFFSLAPKFDLHLHKITAQICASLGNNNNYNLLFPITYTDFPKSTNFTSLAIQWWEICHRYKTCSD